jgi:DGQHR domain-containing protein
MKITQPIGEFYVGAMKAKDLVEIAWFDIRQLDRRQGNVDSYLGIQRRLNEARVKELAQYVNTVDATFPTAVILAVDEVCASASPLDCSPATGGNFYQLTLSNRPGEFDDSETVLFREIARVIDGQHRIAGLKDYTGEADAFQINVAVFVGADIADQANIFSTVNLAQTKVNRSLVYDLFEYAQSRSPEKTCHDVAILLDREKGSPFSLRIKRLGTATEGRSAETLGQSFT